MRRVFEPINCAMACPAIAYTEDEWEKIKSYGLYIFAATLVSANAVFIWQCYHFWAKPFVFCRLMFILGFCATSILMVTFMSINGINENRVTCEGNYAAIEHSPLCEFQACMMVFLVIWTQMWSLFMAFECFNYVSSAAVDSSQPGKYNSVYLALTVAVSSLCAFIPLANGNFGFDLEATAPFCFYMVSETTFYLFATLVYPFMIFGGGCILLTCATIYKIQRTFVLSDQYSRGTSSSLGTRETEMVSSSIPISRTQSRLSATTITSSFESPFFEDTGSNSIAVSFTPSPDSDVVSSARRNESLSASCPPQNVHRMTIWGKITRLAVKTWRYSGRQLIFVITFAMATGFIVPAIFYAFGERRLSFVNGTEEFSACLILASLEYSVMVQFQGSQEGADQFAADACGDRPNKRVHLNLVCSNLVLLVHYLFHFILMQVVGIVTWYAAYGLFPVLVYGITSDNFRFACQRLFQLLPSSNGPSCFAGLISLSNKLPAADNSKS